MRLSIQWDVLSAKTWDLKDETGIPVTLLQSKDYAAAYCPLNRQICTLGRISWRGDPAGTVQIYETSVLGGALHTMILDRGPIWFPGFGTPDQSDAFFAALAARYPRRIGRMRRIIPELLEGPETEAMLKRHGYRRKPGPGYKTLQLDLAQDLDSLRGAMRKSWRATLSKAEKQTMDLVWDDHAKPLVPFTGLYDADRKEKGYSGPSVDLLRAFGRSFGVTGTMPIGIAMINGQPAAGVLILRHGSAATYQVGWSLPAGRQASAHHRLLWAAIERLKAAGVMRFDLGGINETDAAGVTDFKRGLAGKAVPDMTLAGFFT